MSAKIIHLAAEKIRDDQYRLGNPDPFLLAVADWLDGVAKARPMLGWREWNEALSVARTYLNEDA